MRCTNCRYAKETIPEQLRYIYCTKYEKEMSVVDEFEKCQYEETIEYKLKVAIQKYCNDENNFIVTIKILDMLNTLANQFNIPSFIEDIRVRRNFESLIFDILAESKIKLDNICLVSDLGDSHEIRERVLILNK